MGWLRKKKIQKKLNLLLLLALILPAVFVATGNAVAQDQEGDYPMYTGQAKPVADQLRELGKTNTSAVNEVPAAQQPVTPGTCDLYEVDCYLKKFVVYILQTFLGFLFRFVMIPAATGFAWTVDPATMTGPSGTLNLAAVYSLWQFIRDFFNLFFILILLFSAFATIFQVESFNIRNIFKNILLVALFINFSFPITRFLIDAANVPMYYFINDVLGDGQNSGGMIAMQSMFAYSGTGATAFTNVQNNDIAPLIMGIIFVFLFSISLFTLALMMIIRLIALTMLLIFSPIGFAASLLPGLDRFGREWWENFWKYALFGPAAALMLMISLKFMGAVAGSGIWSNLGGFASGVSPDASQATFLAQVVFFCIPIIMIWFTIGMAGKSSLVGASVVVGLGYALPKMVGNYAKKGAIGTARFAGRTAVGTTKAVANRVPILRSVPGAYAGVKEAVKGDGKLFGKQLIPKAITGDAFKARSEAVEARNAGVKGFVQGGRKGADDELRKLEDERVKKQVKENKEKQKDRTKLLKDVRDPDSDSVTRKAAALSLAEEGYVRTAEELADVLGAVKDNQDYVFKVIDKAKPEAIGSMNSQTHEKVQNSFYERDEKDPTKFKVDSKGQRIVREKFVDVEKMYNSKLKKEGAVKAQLDYTIKTNQESGMSPDVAKQAAYDKLLDLKAEDMAKQSTLIQSMNPKSGNVDGALRAYLASKAKDTQYSQDVLKNMKATDREIWKSIRDDEDMRGRAQAAAQPGETVSDGGVILTGGNRTR